MVTGVSFEFYTCYVSITVRAHNEDVTVYRNYTRGAKRDPTPH